MRGPNNTCEVGSAIQEPATAPVIAPNRAMPIHEQSRPMKAKPDDRPLNERGCPRLAALRNLASTLRCCPSRSGTTLERGRIKVPARLMERGNGGEDVDGSDAWPCADLCIAGGRAGRCVADTDRATGR